jgi:two-component system KDP operon response regulator KdpE
VTVVNSKRVRVLVIDDEPQIHRLFASALTAAGYEPLRAETGRQALVEIACRSPDVVVLDLGLPDMDGREVLRQAQEFYAGPILILSARGREIEKIDALDQGAEDYIEKPFDVGELMARIRVALRRRRPQANRSRVLKAGDLTIDLERRLVKRQGEVLRLSTKEYELLVKLAEVEGKILSYSQLLLDVWGPDYTKQVQNLRVCIAQIRQKIESDPSKPKIIQTKKGVGYHFVGNLLPDAG